MKISLHEITPENFAESIKLKVAEDQKGFVASNVKSIAEAKIYSYLKPLAVYDGEQVVGFAMYGRDPETENYWIVRLMIDAQFQGKGYGKAATVCLIKKIKQLPEADAIFLSFVPANTGAEKLYLSVGFERTGETDADGEIIMRLSL